MGEAAGVTPGVRIHPLNGVEPRPDGAYVLYWMVAARRTAHSHALDHALALSRHHRRPLLVLEALRAGYRWACPRHHRFVMDGMDDNAAAFARAGVTAIRYVEPRHGAGAGLVEALAERAVVAVTDLWPGFFVPRMQARVAPRLRVRLEAVDGVGVLPLAASDRAYPTAAGFRRHLQRTLLPHLDQAPDPEPLTGYDGGRAPVPTGITERWPGAATLDEVTLANDTPVVAQRGGPVAGGSVLQRFLEDRIDRYHDDRKHPDRDASSGLSPYLHHGHVGAAEIVRAVLERADWSPDRTGPANGSRGWWGLPDGPEAFLDELVTWRELGQGFAYHQPDTWDTWESVPRWARASLAEHGSDPREGLPFERLEAARSGDPLWDAAQRQLLVDGHIHNHLRMLWGKKVLGWAPTPRIAFDWLTELNNRYALDGRDPNSATGIAWIFGRHDRAWGPERPIYGKVRYMTSQSTGRKLQLRGWLERYRSA